MGEVLGLYFFQAENDSRPFLAYLPPSMYLDHLAVIDNDADSRILRIADLEQVLKKRYVQVPAAVCVKASDYQADIPAEGFGWLDHLLQRIMPPLKRILTFYGCEPPSPADNSAAVRLAAELAEDGDGAEGPRRFAHAIKSAMEQPKMADNFAMLVPVGMPVPSSQLQ